MRKKKRNEQAFNDGIDAHWDWIQASIYHLVKLGVLPEETVDLIFEKSENLSQEEFNEYMDESYKE